MLRPDRRLRLVIKKKSPSCPTVLPSSRRGVSSLEVAVNQIVNSRPDGDSIGGLEVEVDVNLT